MAGSARFSDLCMVFEHLAAHPSKRLKDREKYLRPLRRFFTLHCRGKEAFQALRLILPKCDMERRAYNMQEPKMAAVLAVALGLPKDCGDYKNLINWRQGGEGARKNVGQFALTAYEVLKGRQATSCQGTTLDEINSLLDKLSLVNKLEDRASIFREFLTKTSPREMKWVFRLLQGELKLQGISQTCLLKTFHPDAPDFWNVCCNLRALSGQLNSPNIAWKREDICVGRPFVVQHSLQATSVQTAWEEMRNKTVVMERKFDGDRMLIHKEGDTIMFVSRHQKLHPEYEKTLGESIIKNILPEKCILDGELLVWDDEAEDFAVRLKGTNSEAARAERKNIDTGSHTCYVAFDILYLEDRSLLHLPLSERKLLLGRSVKEITGRLYHLLPGRAPWSALPRQLAEAEEFYEATVTGGGEGVVLKDLDFKYTCADRSGTWKKIKPDYVEGATDNDVLIIGAYYGRGKAGGKIRSYLLAVAEASEGEGHPTKFLSLCRVGSGFTTSDLESVNKRLEPYIRPNVRGSKPPAEYVVTAVAGQRPDVWIYPPHQSLILEIGSDNQLRPSRSFAAAYAPIFNRLVRVRYDKPWFECMTTKELFEKGQGKGGLITRIPKYGPLVQGVGKRGRNRGRTAADPRPLIPLHLQATNTQHVQATTHIFKGLTFFFCNYPPSHTPQTLATLVAEAGGSTSASSWGAVTHVIAGYPGGLKFQACPEKWNVLSCQWLLECVEAGWLLTPKPRHFLRQSEATRVENGDVMDLFGDLYGEDSNEQDVKQILSSMTSDTSALLEPGEDCDLKGIFAGCCLYINSPEHLGDSDSEAVAATVLLRLSIEWRYRGGRISPQLAPLVTHVVAFCEAGNPVSFTTLLARASSEEQAVLRSPRVEVVAHTWLEACLAEECRLEGHSFSLRPDSEVEIMSPPLSLSGCDLKTPSLTIPMAETPTSEASRQPPAGSPGLKKRPTATLLKRDLPAAKRSKPSVPRSTSNAQCSDRGTESDKENLPCEACTLQAPLSVIRSAVPSRTGLPMKGKIADVVTKTTICQTLEVGYSLSWGLSKGSGGREGTICSRKPLADLILDRTSKDLSSSLKPTAVVRKKVSFREQAMLYLHKV